MMRRELPFFPWASAIREPAKSGDLPPRPECAEHWRQPLLGFLPHIALTLVIGQYAHAWHLGKRQKDSLTDTVKNWKDYWPDIIGASPSQSAQQYVAQKKSRGLRKRFCRFSRDRVSQLLT